MLWLLASAVAAELLVWVPAGAVELGARSQVGVWCADCGGPLAASELRVSGAAVLASREVAGGALLLDLAPPEGRSLEIAAPGRPGSPSAAIAVALPPAPAVNLLLPAELALAEGSVELKLHAPAALGAPDLHVQASEGEVGTVRAGPDGYAVTLRLAPDRVARPLLVSASLRSQPGTPPAFAATRLRARITANIAAEAGTRMTIRLGGRSYGPFTAGPEGTANVSFDAYPGESTYELTVADDLGNTQRLVQNIPASQRPVLLGAGVSTARGGEMWMAATDARGAAWSGAPPACRSGSGTSEAPSALDRGRWRWPTASAGVAAGCSLSEASITVRLPTPPAAPAALTVRVYPEVLSADFPLAEVQASLLDAAGERVAPDGLELVPVHGALSGRQSSGNAYRFEYDGTGAAALGGDQLRARWSPPAGSGPPAEVRLCTGLGQAGTVAVARALDALGRPLVGVEMAFAAGAEALPPVATDARGYARALLPAVNARRVRAQAGAAAAETLALDTLPGDAGCIAAAEPGRADLDALISIPIRSGRVRQVFLDTEPATLTLGPGATARIRTRMLDSAGAPVRDEPLKLEASEGVVSAPALQPDGSFVAEFTPAPSPAARQVRISANTSAGTVATTLSVAPRPVRGLTWAAAGWTSNFSAVSSPWASVGFEHRLPLAGLSFRGGAGLYGLDTTVTDGEQAVHAQGTFFPIELGVTLTDRGPRFSLGAGLGVAIVPYTLTADYADGERVGGAGLAPPGVDVHGAAGWRIGQTELFTELAYLLYLAPEGPVTVEGNAGGLRVIGGYRLLY